MALFYVYCCKCGNIQMPENSNAIKNCALCGSKMFKIDPRWEITNEKHRELMNKVGNKEITYDQMEQQWEDLIQRFYEEFLFHTPGFNKEDFDLKEERRTKNHEEHTAYFNKYIKPQMEKEARKCGPEVKCPYCKSYNTKKISAASRGLSVGLFGLGSKKIGKQYHCKSCGADF